MNIYKQIYEETVNVSQLYIPFLFESSKDLIDESLLKKFKLKNLDIINLLIKTFYVIQFRSGCKIPACCEGRYSRLNRMASQNLVRNENSSTECKYSCAVLKLIAARISISIHHGNLNRREGSNCQYNFLSIV
mgnify:CR=1 FL=1